MRTVFKILLVPVWLLLAVLKIAFKLAAGAAEFVLAIIVWQKCHCLCDNWPIRLIRVVRLACIPPVRISRRIESFRSIEWILYPNHIMIIYYTTAP